MPHLFGSHFTTMNKLILGSLSLIGGLAAVASCTPIAQGKKPTYTDARSSGTPLPTLQQGYGVYMRQCHQCHEQPNPKELTTVKWKSIVPNMADHAGITEAEGEAVLKYLLSQR